MAAAADSEEEEEEDSEEVRQRRLGEARRRLEELSPEERRQLEELAEVYWRGKEQSGAAESEEQVMEGRLLELLQKER